MTNAAGKAMFRSGVSQNGREFGSNGYVYDIVIQPDGKIILTGETMDELNPYFQGAGTSRNAGFIIRLNPNGSLDTSFGTNGIAKFAAPIVGTNCYPSRRFYGITLQSDGRIVAAGHDSVVNSTCTPGNRFVVTRWTASGQFETARYLDNNTTFNNQRERATAARFTGDGGKILVSGSYDCKATLVRLNSTDLSVDTTFGTNGITGYAQGCGVSTANFGTTLYLQAIQRDGRLLGIDDTIISGTRTVRFNPDGTGDQSFGNASWNGTVGLLGRLDLLVTNYNGVINPLAASTALVRPNGRINLVGSSTANSGQGISRGVVSQQNTVFKNGIYSDFTNDGRSEIAVYRPGNGVWYQLDSQNNNFSAFKFGTSSDKLAPADYDGDGKTDRAVFRDGVWYIDQLANGQVRYVNFGLAGDLPRPGDFDGDGLADISVFRPSNGFWYRLNSSNGQFSAIQFGQSGDVPMLGDYDSDGRTDIVVFRPSNSAWYIFRSSDNQVQVNVFGLNGDVPLNGDFHGDGKSDIAVFRPSDRTWYIARPTGVPAQNYDATQFGLSTDTPVSADYDNDGKTDLAVFRNGTWWILKSGNGQVSATQFGLDSDRPVPAAYQP
ncbi:MAG: FG-GAP-like repeat-containing protein, partial [Pyrinomonadaceae bacterium]